MNGGFCQKCGLLEAILHIGDGGEEELMDRGLPVGHDVGTRRMRPKLETDPCSLAPTKSGRWWWGNKTTHLG